jgi:hypothetical protein
VSVREVNESALKVTFVRTGASGGMTLSTFAD